MQKFHIAIICCFILMSACTAGDSYIATSSVADWPFIQSVGGITVGSPTKKNDGAWELPVVCDVSGLTTVTRKPTTMNSGLVVTDVFARVEGKEIYLTVVINNPLISRKTSQCTAVNLGVIKPGEYSIVYSDSNSLHAKPGAIVHQVGTVKFD